MGEQFCKSNIEFEQKTERVQEIFMRLADTAMRLARTYRVPRYDRESRENDSEHSLMVSLQAAAIAAETRPDLDPYEVGFKAIIHELIEIETLDVQTFNISDEDLKAKEQREDDAIERLCANLPPFIADLVRTYQLHEDPASRFVGMIDKTAPVTVDILGPGSMIMHEDYDTFTLDQLQAIHLQLQKRYEKRYPESELKLLHLAQRGLMRQFEQVFEPQQFIQDVLF